VILPEENNMKMLQILELILGTAESVVPIFIHNPKTQQIEGVIATTLNGALSAFPVSASLAAPVAAPAAPVPEATPPA
jgi:hypothetical protein